MCIFLDTIPATPWTMLAAKVEYSDTKLARSDPIRWKPREKGVRSECSRVGPSHGVSHLPSVLSLKTNVLAASASLLRSRPLVRVCVCVDVWGARASAKRRRYVEGTQRGTWGPISSPRQPSSSRLSSQNVRYDISARQSDESSLRHFHHLRVRDPMRPTGADIVVRSWRLTLTAAPLDSTNTNTRTSKILVEFLPLGIVRIVFSARHSKSVCVGLAASVRVPCVRVTAGTRGGTSVRDSGNGDATAIAYQWGPESGNEEGPRA